MNNLNKAILIFILFLCFLKFNQKVLSILAADVLNTQARTLLYAAKIDEAYRSINTAIKLNPQEPGYYRTRATLDIVNAAYRAKTSDQKHQFKNKAKLDLEKAYDLQPYNLVNIKHLIGLYGLLAQNEVGQERINNYDENYKLSAIEFYKKIENKAPNDASVSYSLGEHYKMLEEKDEALKHYQKALDLKTNLAEAKEKIEQLK